MTHRLPTRKLLAELSKDKRVLPDALGSFECLLKLEGIFWFPQTNGKEECAFDQLHHLRKLEGALGNGVPLKELKRHIHSPLFEEIHKLLFRGTSSRFTLLIIFHVFLLEITILPAL